MTQRVWTKADIEAYKLSSLSTWGMLPSYHRHQYGYFQIHMGGELTAAWNRSLISGKATTWRYWRIPSHGQYAVLLLADEGDNIPNPDKEPLLCHKPCKEPIPFEALHILHQAAKWLHRLHASTPVTKWVDTYASDQAKSWLQGSNRHCRVVGTLYSAPDGMRQDLELRFHCLSIADVDWKHECIQIRMDNVSQQIRIQTYSRTSQIEEQKRKHQSLHVEQKHAKDRQPRTLEQWAIAYAVQMNSLVANKGPALHPKIQTYGSLEPHPLDKYQKADLLRRERLWYQNHHTTWPFR